MAFIKLTGINKDPIYFNPSHIAVIVQNKNNTQITAPGTSDNESTNEWNVIESPDEVLRLIREAEQ